MTTRRSLLREEAARTLLWLALAVAGVDLVARADLRLDLTRDGRFGLSDVAIESVSALERPMSARVFFSEGLEAPYHQHRQALIDLLDELARRSRGQLRVEVVDPTGDPALVAEAARFGVRPLPYAYRAWDRTESRAVFMGVSFVYGERQVAVDALPSLARMELDVVRAIRAVTREPEERPSLGWWIGHGEPDPLAQPEGSPVGALVGQLRERGAFRAVASGDLPIPGDLDLLLVVAPREPVPSADLLHLDQFVARGGRALVFASSVVADVDRLALVEADHGLRPWLGHLGAVLGTSVLVDRDDHEAIALPGLVGGRRQRMRVDHPLVVVTTEVDRAVRAVRQLPRVVLPFAAPVSLADPLPAGVEGEVWVRTDATSSSVPAVRSLDPAAVKEVLPGESPGPFPVVVALSGRFPSLFTERELPPRLDPEAPPFAREDLLLVGEPSRVVVVGSGDAAANALDLTTNAVDWLLEDEALIDIRARAEGDPPLEAPPRGRALQAKVAMTGLPLLAIAAGLAWVSRRRRLA